MIVGLTGGIGSGKTTVLNGFKKFEDVAIYNADIEAKQLMHSSIEIRKKLIEQFGENAYKEKQLNRKFISEIVFKDKEKLKILNSIVHPAVKKHFQNFVENNKEKSYILYENAILFETKNDTFCNVVISVFSPLEVRLERLIKRDKTTKEAILNRMKNQFSETKKMLQSHYVIYNTTSESLENQIQRIHNILT